MKLLLVYPEIECSVTNTSTYTIPLGLGSIATYCKERMGGSLEVRILDGSMMTHQEQLEETQRFKPDFTGISPTIASQGNAYEIAQEAHNLGSKVYFGGVNSTNLWRNMLVNRNFIDGVVLFEGEKAVFNLLQGKLGPNVAYRDRNGNVCPPSGIEVMDLADLPDIDYTLFDLESFFEQTQKRGFGRAISYYAGKGCSKRGGAALKGVYSLERYNHLVELMPACTFCGRNEVGLRDFGEDREARIVRELHDNHGVRGFFNVQDTVNLGNASPIGLEDSWFRLFIGTENITSKNIAKLKQR
ncbi:cobalamin-dependent protein, partial [Candidatus Woesearchaeota archaeon]|nr:cobalamin-dependent protein [Candidatus Woesearchaeota archaeon]